MSLDSPNLLNGVLHHFLRFLLDDCIAMEQKRLIHLLHEGVKQHLPLLAV